MNIFVGNLSFEAKEIDVQKAFAGFGVVASVTIVMEKKGKKSRGFGFVEMPLEQEALAAIAALNGKEILGRPINVIPALPKKPKSEVSEKKDQHFPILKRTGKYKQGRRSISFMKKRPDSGAAFSDSRPKFKANPLRWRKRTSWSKPAQTSKPWDKTSQPSKPWQKREGSAKPWQKREGGAKPWQKKEGSAKPWKKREGSAKPTRFKRTNSIVRNKR